MRSTDAASRLVLFVAMLVISTMAVSSRAYADAVVGECAPRGHKVVDASEGVGIVERIPDGPVVGGAPRMPAQYRVPDPNEVQVETVVSQLEVPWSFDFAPDGRLFVSERPGRVRVVRDGVLDPEPWATLAVIPMTDLSEGGLMGLVLSPTFDQEPWVYVCYTFDNAGQVENRVSRLREIDGRGADEQILVDHIPGAAYHNGCRLKFGPDGKLYVTTGDAYQPDLAQDLTALAGKILRLNPDGSVPADNPFGAESLVYSYGHRNSQGLAFDFRTGVLFATEHGPTGEFGLYTYDEVNVIVAGGNYGWPLVVGAPNVPPYRDPLLCYPNSDPYAAVPPAGATFYLSDTIPQWTGNFFFASLGAQHLQRVVFNGSDDVVAIERLFERQFDGVYGRLRDVIQGPDGALYVSTSNRDGRGHPAPNDDRILRIIPASPKANFNRWTSHGPYDDGAVVSALAIDPSAPAILYAGAGSAYNSGIAGAGVVKSIDGAGSWSNTGASAIPRALVIDPNMPTTLYAADASDGVFKSTDGGCTWRAANTGLTTNVWALAIDPISPATLYAGTFAGVFKSVDRGGTWFPLNGLPIDRDVVALAIDPAVPTTLYAAVDGVYKSTDGGSTWSAVNNGLPTPYVTALAIDPTTSTTLYAGTESFADTTSHSGNIFKSIDGGRTWNVIYSPPSIVDVTALAIDPITPTTLYGGTSGGVVKSTDSGRTWGPLNTGLTNLFVNALAIDPLTPTTLYAGTNGGGVFSIQQVSMCIGDCNDNDQVTIDEILTLVTGAVTGVGLPTCPSGDANDDGQITIDEVLAAVNNALNGCGNAVSSPTPTPTSLTVTPTPTEMTTPS